MLQRISRMTEDLFSRQRIIIASNALEYASENLKNDRQFVLKAVQSNGSALCEASENLKNDREIVLEAHQKKAKSRLVFL
jgi:hypothetical protein